MQIDYEMLLKILTDRGLLNKTISSMNKLEVNHLCSIIREVSSGGFALPYIKDDTLIIPFDAPMKYRHWLKGSEPLIDTLVSLGASREMIERYVPATELDERKSSHESDNNG